MRIISSRYKPLYKKFIRLRKNIQNRKKVNLGKFHKKKWVKLNNYLKKQYYLRKKKYKTYDLNSYYVKRYGNNNFKKKFLLSLLNKQSLSLFYGYLKNFYLKKIIKSSVNISKNLKEPKISYLLTNLENRLDTVLYRSHFTKSLREARNLITHGHVYINSIKIKNSRYSLLKGDLLSVHSANIRNNILQSNIWPVPPESLLINYRMLIIIYLGELKTNIFFNKLPFYINYNNFISYYEKN